MKIAPLRPKIIDFIQKHNLSTKFQKQIAFLKINLRHPGLHVELLEPKERGIKSFRIDRSYRGLFIYDQKNDTIHIIAITQHYH